MIHLSDIRKLERCPRYFYLSKRIKKDFIPYINFNENMSELILQRFQLKDVMIGKANDDSTPALQAIKAKKPILNGRLVYRDLRIKVPLLIQEDNRVLLYMIYKSCYPKEREAQNIADLVWVLKQFDIHIDEIYAIHLNQNYVREEELDVSKLLIVNEYLFNNKNKAHNKILDLVTLKMRDLDKIIDQLHEIDQCENIEAKKTINCTRGNKCPYYEDCFFDEVEDDSILHLVQSGHKFNMMEEGIKSMKDVDIDRIEGTRHQYAQIMAARNGGRYIDSGAITCWLKEFIQKPISYLDFEWETFAFPPYQGMKPFDVLTFQYSLHMENEQGELSHTGFIGEGDCREAFIQSLLKEIPKQGTILVFNMEGAEKLRLRQLANQFPQYEKQLQDVYERMVDLSLPFATGNIYDLRMQGGFSLKTLVPIFSDYNYQDLAISYGMDAVEKWRMYCQCENPVDKKVIYDQLMEYCSMDTYAEYIVIHALINAVKKS